jgi:hypothetical protein
VAPARLPPAPWNPLLIFYPFSSVPKTPRAELTQLIDICALDKALLVIRKPGSYLLYYRFSQANLSPGW